MRYYYDARIEVNKLEIEADSMEQAEELLGNQLEELFNAAPYNTFPDVELELSDDQDGLDELLNAIDEDQPFYISADASVYHIECAKVAYGEKAVEKAILMSSKYSDETIVSRPTLFERYPKDREGNLLHVVYGRDHIRDVRNAWENQEEVFCSCVCLNSVYDDPKEEQEDANN